MKITKRTKMGTKLFVLFLKKMKKNLKKLYLLFNREQNNLRLKTSA
jgi:hypothetical protein